MAQKSHVIESRQREARQQQYLSAPSLEQEFPTIKEVVVELRFVDPDNKNHPSPHKRIFVSDMQAFFEFHCPIKECSNGGFSLSETIMDGLSRRKSEMNGKMSCGGKWSRDKGPAQCCGLELHYHVSAVRKSKAAA
jgi:hypothetical protein